MNLTPEERIQNVFTELLHESPKSQQLDGKISVEAISTNVTRNLPSYTKVTIDGFGESNRDVASMVRAMITKLAKKPMSYINGKPSDSHFLTIPMVPEALADKLDTVAHPDMVPSGDKGRY